VRRRCLSLCSRCVHFFTKISRVAGLPALYTRIAPSHAAMYDRNLHSLKIASRSAASQHFRRHQRTLPLCFLALTNPFEWHRNLFNINTLLIIDKRLNLCYSLVVTFRLRQRSCSPGRVFYLFFSNLQPQHLTSVFSIPCKLFCLTQNLNLFVFNQFRTLLQKHPGVGVSPAPLRGSK
jgi:hypothetical protein